MQQELLNALIQSSDRIRYPCGTTEVSVKRVFCRCRMLAAFQAPWNDCLAQLAGGSVIALALLLCGQAASVPLRRLLRPIAVASQGHLLTPARVLPAYVATAATASAVVLLWAGQAQTSVSVAPLALAVAVAPAGALLRWRLSDLNKTPAGALLSLRCCCNACQ